jgi:cystathionine beta-lyase
VILFTEVTNSAFDERIERRNTKSLKWTRYAPDILPLWVADMDFRAPEPVREALRATIDHGVFGYELPGKELAETVAARMHSLYQWEVSPEAIVAVPGIVAGFKAAARAVCNPGDGLLVQPPVYHPFLEVPGNTDAVAQFAALRQVNSDHLVSYQLDMDRFEAAFTSDCVRTSMFLLCHPHNPIGKIFTASELERMAHFCDKKGVAVCSDEIHSELLLGGARHMPFAKAAAETAVRTVTLLSPSKTFNLVGLFCGFAIIPDAALRSRYKKVLQQSALHVNSLGLIAAQVAFSGACEDWLRDLRQYLTANRDLLLDFVSRELPGVRVTKPDATYLAWLDFGDLVRDGRLPADVSRYLLKKAKVALNPGAEFGQGGEHFVRLNFACPRSTLTEALERIRNAVQ